MLLGQPILLRGKLIVNGVFALGASKKVHLCTQAYVRLGKQYRADTRISGKVSPACILTFRSRFVRRVSPLIGF